MLSRLCNPDVLHAQIMNRVEGFVSNRSLFRLLDEEYSNYLNGEGGYYYRWLAGAVNAMQPRRILELGSYTGGSILCMLQELGQSSELISVDMEKDLRFCPPEVFDDVRIRFVFGNDLDLSIFGGNIPFDVDFLFIDTDHTYQQIAKEWSVYQHLLSNEAIVVLDDIRLNDMYRFWQELDYKKLETTDDCHISGFGFFVFRREPEADEEARLRAAFRASLQALSSR